MPHVHCTIIVLFAAMIACLPVQAEPNCSAPLTDRTNSLFSSDHKKILESVKALAEFEANYTQNLWCKKNKNVLDEIVNNKSALKANQDQLKTVKDPKDRSKLETQVKALEMTINSLKDSLPATKLSDSINTYCREVKSGEEKSLFNKSLCLDSLGEALEKEI